LSLLGVGLVAVLASGAEQPCVQDHHWGDGQFSGGLDPAIAQIATGGFWSSGSQSGTYRIVVLRFGDEHTYSATYVQWLGVDPQTDREEEVATVAVKPLSDLVLAVVSDVGFVRADAKGPAVAEVTLRNRYSGETKKSWLILRGPGDFTVTDSPEKIPR
jgi:hypothetical protein